MAEKPKRVSPAAVVALKNALSVVYWYRNDLRSFIVNAISAPEVLAAVNWQDTKRDVVDQLINRLVENQDRYLHNLLDLMAAVLALGDCSHLAVLEDGKEKQRVAAEAVRTLRSVYAGHQDLEEDRRHAEERRTRSAEQFKQNAAARYALEELKERYIRLFATQNRQARGYELEKLLKDVFAHFDLDPKASFRIEGEQIDGLFTFEQTDYLLEARWRDQLTSPSDLDVFSGKIGRKLDNTLGLFLSVNGYTPDAIAMHSGKRSTMILMNGADLMAVLEGRIDLGTSLRRKRRYASETGNIFLPVTDILAGR